MGENQSHVSQQTRLPDIAQVHVSSFGISGPTPPQCRPWTEDTRSHRQEPLRRISLEPTQLFLDQWARPDEGHVSSNDVPQLRELVQLGPPKEATHVGDAGVPCQRKLKPVHPVLGHELLILTQPILRTNHHRSKFEALEGLSTPPYPPVSKEDGATRENGIGQRDAEKKRRGQRHQSQRGKNVEQALH